MMAVGWRGLRNRALALLLVVMGHPACSADAEICVGEEIVHVKMTGSCAPGPREFDVVRVGCGVTLTNAAPDVRLPDLGTIDREGHVLRRGGWQIYGCAGGEEPCPQDFRRCTTRRVDWQLDLSCLDGMGALACEATLME